jgi:predicted Rossmann fold nucleotide-binding protein DprA/Smf involved in DNA uptake
LTPPEWGRFALWLKERGAAPDALLSDPNPAHILEGWSDKSVTLDRISTLLRRSAALGLALEKWERAGLWVMTRSDPEYPARLKRHLKFDAPPILFGCGNRQLLAKGGIAIVGSRDASAADLEFTKAVARSVADQRRSVVSGGARGVDESAMLAAMEEQGTVIGVLPDNLLRAATSVKYRQAILDDRVVLISPFNPQAGFEVGNAMARNKYIYCLSDLALVIATGKGKGGTWNGAVENLRSNWVPLWVKRSDDEASGAAALVDLGARWLPESSTEVGDVIAATAGPIGNQDLFAPRPGCGARVAWVTKEPAKPYEVEPVLGSSSSAEQMEATSMSAPTVIANTVSITAEAVSDEHRDLSLYDHFLAAMSRATSLGPLKIDELCQQLDLHETQMKVWLARAVAEGTIVKLTRPVRYQVAQVSQAKLFEAT